MVDLSGTCMCSAVRWSCSGTPTRNLVCHCMDCQRATSSPFTAFIGLAPQDLQWTGTPTHYESSPGTFRGFCPACGTRLYFRSLKWPGEIHMHAVTLDDHISYVPTAQVVMRSRVAWIDHLPDIPGYQSFETAPGGRG